MTRVLAAADNLNYRLNPIARATANGVSPIVSLIVDDARDPHFALIAEGAVAQSTRHGYIVTTVGTSAYNDDLSVVAQAVAGLRPRAMIFIPRGSNADRSSSDPVVNRFRSENGGLAIIGAGEDWASRIQFDHSSACAELAASLFALGYRRPLIVDAPVTRFGTGERSVDLINATRSWSARHPDVVTAPDITRDAGYEMVHDLLVRQAMTADVIIAVTDMVAIGVMSALRDAGLAPGHDVGVTGFDDVRPARDVYPGLTTVRIPLFETGSRAVELALSGGAPESVTLTSSVVIRGSTLKR